MSSLTAFLLYNFFILFFPIEFCCSYFSSKIPIKCTSDSLFYVHYSHLSVFIASPSFIVSSICVFISWLFLPVLACALYSLWRPHLSSVYAHFCFRAFSHWGNCFIENVFISNLKTCFSSAAWFSSSLPPFFYLKIFFSATFENISSLNELYFPKLAIFKSSFTGEGQVAFHSLLCYPRNR